MFKLTFFVLCAVLLGTGSSFARILDPSSFDAVISSTPVIAIAQADEGENPNATYFDRSEKMFYLSRRVSKVMLLRKFRSILDGI